jgi:phosphatidylserine/phosphatidylglycerophosphate/cardiolipin synthase-like enzyme
MPTDFINAVEQLIRKAPAVWLASACDALRTIPATATTEFVLQRMPVTNNADLSLLIGKVLRIASSEMSWEALSWAIGTTSNAYTRWRAEQAVELLWAGPSPASQIPARRIDQALYDLIAQAKREIVLVTFAAAKIERLSGALLQATQRGVHVRLILEFEQSSEGQLSYDALKAFPATLIATAKVFHWPVDKRERNRAGRPGKLHAKIAIVDDTALVSSANLTDDAFNRNLEIGVLVNSPDFLMPVKTYINSLIADGTICRLRSQ